MRKFTRFEVGQKVSIPEDRYKHFLSISRINQREFTIRRVIADVVKHAYEEDCHSEDCLHAWSHPDQYEVDNGRILSGYWLDSAAGVEGEKGK